MRRGMSVGQLAKAAGVGVETIRYYQRRGLLPTPPRPVSGQRQYSEAVVRQIGFIRRAQELGFTLEEIKRLLSLADARHCASGRDMAHAKAVELAARVAELNRMRRELLGYIRRCDANPAGAPCPFVQALHDEGVSRRGGRAR